MGEWRTIESAPKETDILAMLPHSDTPLIIAWLEDKDWEGFSGPGWYVSWDHFFLTGATDEPTHWQPLPPPPDAGGQG